jgi:hypothetical protein
VRLRQARISQNPPTMLNHPPEGGLFVRRWLWPYAILAVMLSVLGLTVLGVTVVGAGTERAGAQLAVADAIVVEPVMRFLISMLEMVAPVDLPNWFKQVYAVLALVAVIGLALSLVLGLLLLPVFYALYRGADAD